MSKDVRETEQYVAQLVKEWEDQAELAALELAKIEHDYLHIATIE